MTTRKPVIKLDKGDTRLIIKEAKKLGYIRQHTAYALATTYHETAFTLQPVREYGGDTYLRSKAYWPYVGMGYVQLTWKHNYELASKKLGVDFIGNPRKLLEPAYAVVVLLRGMAEGWFTNKKLSDYINDTKTDYVAARRIINGRDKATVIAGYAKVYDALLLADGYDNPEPQPEPVVALVETPVYNAPSVWERVKALFSRLFANTQE